jgi:hypothetical protein
MNKIKYIYFHLMRQVKSYKLRNILASFQSFIKRKESITGISLLFNINNEPQKVEELIKNGYTELGLIKNKDLVDELITNCKALNLYDPFDKEKHFFDADNIPEDTHVAMYSRNDLAQNENVLKIANDPSVLRVVQDFLGTVPTISNINMWWSTSNHSQAKDAQFFHRDVDDIKFCKLFVYLTDVGPNDGPHTFVKGSTSSDKLTYIRRYTDDEIIKNFGKENIINFIRPKYSCFIVNSYGFHKGTLPIDNDRLLLQVQYSINPIAIENYTPIELSHSYNKYINRLILE